MKHILEFNKFKGNFLNEAQKYDIEAAMKDIREFNRQKFRPKKYSELIDRIEKLAMDIIKNLGLY